MNRDFSVPLRYDVHFPDSDGRIRGRAGQRYSESYGQPSSGASRTTPVFVRVILKSGIPP